MCWDLNLAKVLSRWWFLQHCVCETLGIKGNLLVFKPSGAGLEPICLSSPTKLWSKMSHGYRFKRYRFNFGRPYISPSETLHKPQLNPNSIPSQSFKNPSISYHFPCNTVGAPSLPISSSLQPFSVFHTVLSGVFKQAIQLSMTKNSLEVAVDDLIIMTFQGS